MTATPKPRAGEHTKGPWQQALIIETRDGAKGAYPSAAIQAAISGEDVAVCCGKDKGKANAAHIVHAVNAYPKLVAALQMLLICVDNFSPTWDTEQHCRALLRELKERA